MDIDKQLKVGDMAVVIKWPCCGTHIGKVSVIKDIWPVRGGKAHCNDCGRTSDVDDIVQLDNITSAMSWMKKIPPLSDDDKTEFLEDLKNDILSPTTV